MVVRVLDVFRGDLRALHPEVRLSLGRRRQRFCSCHHEYAACRCRHRFAARALCGSRWGQSLGWPKLARAVRLHDNHCGHLDPSLDVLLGAGVARRTCRFWLSTHQSVLPPPPLPHPNPRSHRGDRRAATAPQALWRRQRGGSPFVILLATIFAKHCSGTFGREPKKPFQRCARERLQGEDATEGTGMDRPALRAYLRLHTAFRCPLWPTVGRNPGNDPESSRI